ncbi:universal stress protein [Acidiferrimicrobium sp. IK]|uniref:universal stress protein n=1 Tax=Acidiferrimicrobium sp. IK TaxID=2871700 RepID=UPI0021CB4AC8|nr:universal stress protein [Acidiferrimicrobium sp. IK]MCU4184421.1 universal stress protein [Acidiferrimicrobium sp. IK]
MTERYVIVVGSDGSDGSVAALKWAVQEAAVRGGSVRVVRAWSPGEFGTNDEMGALALQALQGDVKTALDGDAPVPVETVAVQGHPSAVLLEQSKDADMLVVGSRGLGGFTGLLLRSVGQSVLKHEGAATVVIVRR